MKHYPNLMARLFNVPLLIDPAKASVIFTGLAARMGLRSEGEIVAGPASDHVARQRMDIPGASWCEGGYQVTRGGIAVVTIDGSLVHTAAGAYPPSGMTSYGEVRDQMETAAGDPAVRAILMDVDSPGGEGSDSAFALSARIRELRTAKPIWAVCDETACSAAYLLASAADKVFAPSLGYIGSIGVYMALLDATKADEMEGLAWTFIHAGAHKLDGNPSVALNKEFVARMQGDVDAIYARFLTEVGASRPNLGTKGAKATEARFYRGSEALEAGLIDGIADFPAVLQQLQAKLSAPSLPLMQVRQEVPAGTSSGDVSHEAAAAAVQTQETSMETTEKTTAPASATNVVDINAARKEGSDAARQEVAEIVELCTLAGQPALATNFITQGKSVAEVRKELVAAKARSTAGSEITSVHGGPSAPVNGGGTALIGECKRLAEAASKKTA